MDQSVSERQRSRRVVLRRPVHSDIDELFLLATEHGVMSLSSFCGIRVVTLDDMRRAFNTAERLQELDLRFMFVVADIHSDRPLGMTWLTNVVPKNRAEGGTWLSKRFWGQGLFREVMVAKLYIAFCELMLRRIEARVVVSHQAVRRALEHLGFANEGILRQSFETDGRAEDQILYSLLHSEYAALRSAVANEGT